MLTRDPMLIDLVATTLPSFSQSAPVSSSGILYGQLTEEEIKGEHSLHMVLETYWHHLKWMAAVPRSHM